MKKTASGFLKVMIVLLGIGAFLSIPDLHAAVEGRQEINFQLKIDDSFVDAGRVMSVEVRVSPDNRALLEVTEVFEGGSERSYLVRLEEVVGDTIVIPDEVILRVGEGGVLVVRGFEGGFELFISQEQIAHIVEQVGESFRIRLERLVEDDGIVSGLSLGLSKSVGAGYNVQLFVDDQLDPVVDGPIKLRFPVGDHERAEALRIYFWNGSLEEWELVGGTYQAGYIEAVADQFGIFALFHPDQLASLSESEVVDEGGTHLPITATNIYNFIWVGFIMLVVGSLIFIGRNDRERRLNE